MESIQVVQSVTEPQCAPICERCIHVYVCTVPTVCKLKPTKLHMCKHSGVSLGMTNLFYSKHMSM